MSEWIIFLYPENSPKIDHTIVKLSFVNREKKQEKNIVPLDTDSIVFMLFEGVWVEWKDIEGIFLN